MVKTAVCPGALQIFGFRTFSTRNGYHMTVNQRLRSMKKAALFALLAILACSVSVPVMACGSDADCKGHKCDKTKADASASKDTRVPKKEAAPASENKTGAKTEADSK